MNFPHFQQVCCEAKDDVAAPSSPILDPAVVVAMRELPDAPSHVPQQQQQQQQQRQQPQQPRLQPQRPQLQLQQLQQPHPSYQQVAITGDTHLVEVLNNEAGPSSSSGMTGAGSSSSGGSSGGQGAGTSSGRRSTSETITPFLLMQKMLQGEADLHLPTGEQTIGDLIFVSN